MYSYTLDTCLLNYHPLLITHSVPNPRYDSEGSSNTDVEEVLAIRRVPAAASSDIEIVAKHG